MEHLSGLFQLGAPEHSASLSLSFLIYRTGVQAPSSLGHCKDGEGVYMEDSVWGQPLSRAYQTLPPAVNITRDLEATQESGVTAAG